MSCAASAGSDRPPDSQRPTRPQLETLHAYIAAGSIAAAAHELGISETTARQHLSGLYRRTGCLNAAQAAYWLGAGANQHQRTNEDPGRWWSAAQEAAPSPRTLRGSSWE